MCPFCKNPSDHIKKLGSFTRKTGPSTSIKRYLCRSCGKSFSDQTHTLTYRERKPHLTQKVMRLLMEGSSQRGCARLLGVKQQTVANKMIRLGIRAKTHLDSSTPLDPEKLEQPTVIFDEMETFEHSKCKPLSIVVVVEDKTRKIIAAEVAPMAAKGKLAAISRKKYGRRKSGRKAALSRALQEVRLKYPGLNTLKSDQCPLYPDAIKKVFPGDISHIAFKGRRGCVVGQGELKRGGFDPLFALNHTCAMFRDRIKRLSRRTCCTTKKQERLQMLVHLYAWWHNQRLLGLKSSKIRMA